MARRRRDKRRRDTAPARAGDGRPSGRPSRHAARGGHAGRTAAPGGRGWAGFGPASAAVAGLGRPPQRWRALWSIPESPRRGGPSTRRGFPTLPSSRASRRRCASIWRQRTAPRGPGPCPPRRWGRSASPYHADLFLDHADRAYAAAEALDGGAWRWTYYRALAAGTRGDTDALADGLRRVVAAAPDFGPAWWRLGEAEFKAGRYGRAAEAWRRVPAPGEPATTGAPGPAAAPGPTAAPAAASAGHGSRIGPSPLRPARVRVRGARPRPRRPGRGATRPGAVELLEDATAAAPGFGPAFRLLGDAYATLGRTDEAARAVRTADRLPQYESYLDPLTEALLHESRSTTFLLQQAATADMATNAGWREYLIRRALEFDPDHDVALAELATLYRVVRRYEEALELLEHRRRRRPGDFGVLADIGRCLSGLGRYGEAEEMLRRALEGLDNAATRYALGLALDGAGRLSEAIAEYRRALDRNPNHPEALNNLGVALAAEGRMGEAARHFERLIALDAGNADAHANLGHALAARGARARATGAFREALRLDPDHAGARGGLQDIGPR